MIKFLAACALVEDKAAEVYRTMAAMALADKNETLGALWLEMAGDEEDHAQQVRLAARLVRENAYKQLESAHHEMPGDLLKRADQLLCQVKTGRLSELEMLRIAVELEKHFRKVHTSYTLLFQEPSMRTMFDALARADNQHLGGLKGRICQLTGNPAEQRDA